MLLAFVVCILSLNQMYEKAAAQFKIKKDWKGAGECYIQSATNAEKAKDAHAAVTQYVNAAKAFQNAEMTKEALKWFEIAVHLHMDNNRFSVAAGLWKTMAEMEEKSLNTKGAIKAWTEAAACYKAASAQSSENSCHIHVADLSAEEGDYAKAIALYEDVCKIAAESSTGRWSVKDYLFKASLCQMAMLSAKGDVSSMPAELEKYKVTFPAFDDCREAKFIEDIVSAFEEDDVEKFQDVVFKHDQIFKLDPWKTSILLKVKVVLEGGSGSGGAGDDDAAEDLM